MVVLHKLVCLSAAEGCVFFFSSRRRHTSYWRDWSSDVCSSDLFLCQELRGLSKLDVLAFAVLEGVDEDPFLIVERAHEGHVDRSEERRVGKECKTRLSPQRS